MISLGVHTFFLLLSLVFFKRSLLAWFLISLPSLAIEFWFERTARPAYSSEGGAAELKRAGEDLDAKGLTEFLWDITYWTWGNVVLAAVAGNWAWYLFIAVPVYAAYSAYTTFTGARKGMMGLSGAGGEPGAAGAGSQSKRQAKMEKRGGQRAQYR